MSVTSTNSPNQLGKTATALDQNIALYIDPPARRFLNDQLFNIDSLPYGGDQLLAPYVQLKQCLNAQGIAVHTADQLPSKEDSVKKVYVSIAQLKHYHQVIHRRDVILSAFFAMECPVVEPSLYRALPRIQRQFKRIFSWSDSASLKLFTGKLIQCESFCWPQSFDDVHEDIWNRQERKFLVMINANKLPRINWQELYTERLRALEFFSQTGDIDLFGIGWDQPTLRLGKTWVPYTVRHVQRALQCQWEQFHPDPRLVAARRVYQGSTPSKAETLGQYTFAICFENSILNGWITEKIFDCFFAGTIPVYWGAPDIEQYIPPNCFIDMRNFEDYQALSCYLKSLSLSDIQTYKQNARNYLQSSLFKPFTKDAFVELFCQLIQADTGIQVSQVQL